MYMINFSSILPDFLNVLRFPVERTVEMFIKMLLTVLLPTSMVIPITCLLGYFLAFVKALVFQKCNYANKHLVIHSKSIYLEKVYNIGFSLFCSFKKRTKVTMKDYL